MKCCGFAAGLGSPLVPPGGLRPLVQVEGCGSRCSPQDSVDPLKLSSRAAVWSERLRWRQSACKTPVRPTSLGCRPTLRRLDQEE